MAKVVMVTGCDGYIGHALTLKLLVEGYHVIGLDTFQRRAHVAEMGSFSALPIQSQTQRTSLYQSIGSYLFYNTSTTNSISLKQVFRDHHIDVVVNLAQQPSAPFSHKSRHHAVSTSVNNVNGVLNLLWTMREHCPHSHLIHIGTMGEYDPAVGVEIPEGKFRFWHKWRRSKESIFPRRPGSFYHASKVAATYYIDLASRIWGLRATDIMQGIVYGNWTEEIEKYQSHTRLDSDEAFGTVFNRFVVQAMLDHPLTVYGQGDHKRGFLSLYDSVQCLMIAVKNPPEEGEYRTWNQLVDVMSMNEVADIVIDAAEYYGKKLWVQTVKSPRVETTNKFYYKPTVKTLKNLGYVDDGTTMRDEAFYIFDYFQNHPMDEEDKKKLRNVIGPLITWR